MLISRRGVKGERLADQTEERSAAVVKSPPIKDMQILGFLDDTSYKSAPVIDVSFALAKFE